MNDKEWTTTLLVFLLFGLSLVYVFREDIDCWNDYTDTCVQCVDDCLEVVND